MQMGRDNHPEKLRGQQRRPIWPPFVFDFNFSSWKPVLNYALVTSVIISVPSVTITLFSGNIPVQSIQVMMYLVPFPLTETAIRFHAVNFVENMAQLIVELACFMLI